MSPKGIKRSMKISLSIIENTKAIFGGRQAFNLIEPNFGSDD